MVCVETGSYAISSLKISLPELQGTSNHQPFKSLISVGFLHLPISPLACSTWVIMNRETRKLSKIPEEVKQEVEPFHLNRVAIATEDIDSEKIEKLNNDIADRIRSGLAVSTINRSHFMVSTTYFSLLADIFISSGMFFPSSFSSQDGATWMLINT